jgi:phosphoribosyl 1,2-cyclic phosphodiesterase
VESGDTRLLVDAGFSGRDLERRLAAVEVARSSLTALLITHDHGDHTRGMGVMARRWRLPLYLTEPTQRLRAPARRHGGRATYASAAAPCEIGDLLTVEPFLTVHDAVDPVAVCVTEQGTGEKLGIATDLGRPTSTVRHALQLQDVPPQVLVLDDALQARSAHRIAVDDRSSSRRRRSGRSKRRSSSSVVSTVCRRRAPMFSIRSLTVAARCARSPGTPSR